MPGETRNTDIESYFFHLSAVRCFANRRTFRNILKLQNFCGDRSPLRRPLAHILAPKVEVLGYTAPGVHN